MQLNPEYEIKLFEKYPSYGLVWFGKCDAMTENLIKITAFGILKCLTPNLEYSFSKAKIDEMKKLPCTAQSSLYQGTV